jgi:hypothetical protein
MNKLLTNYEQIMNGCKCISMHYACINMQFWEKNCLQFVHNLFIKNSPKVHNCEKLAACCRARPAENTEGFV